MNEWQKMYCVENHGIFVRGGCYLVKKLNNYTCVVKNNGRIIYENPNFFQMNKVKVVQEEEQEDFDSEYYWQDGEYNDYN